MNKIDMDHEVRSRIDLPKQGLHPYAEDSSTEVICTSYSINDGAVKTWQEGTLPPDDLIQAVAAGYPVFAHNAAFEQEIWNMVIRRDHPNIPIMRTEQMRDTAAMAAAYGLPRKLEKAAVALDLTEQKDDQGKQLIKQLCKPQKNGKFDKDPDKLNQLIDYCEQDVRVEQELTRRIPELSSIEQQIWELTNETNQTGIPVAIDEVSLLHSEVESEIDRLQQECVEITGFRFSQTAKLKEWLQEHGCFLNNLRAATVEESIPKLEGETRRVLEIRQIAAGSAVKKFAKILETTSKDGYLKGQFIYHGAATGRYTSSGVNVQNLARPHIKGVKVQDIFEGKYDGHQKLAALSSCIRSVLKTPDGKTFIDADFSAIENRVAYWITGDTEHLHLYIDGQDEYKVFASSMFNKNIEDITDDERQVAKSGILGCMYGSGAETYQNFAKIFDVEVNQQEAQQIVDTYRFTHPLIVGAWGNCEQAAMTAVTEGVVTRYSKIMFDGQDPNILSITLPSGRNMVFQQPYIGTGRFNNDVLKVRGINSETDLYSSRLFQNIVQATARDILVDAMLRVPKSLGQIVGTFHDEILIMTDEKYAKKKLGNLINIMSSPPAWASDLPLAAEGWHGNRFRK